MIQNNPPGVLGIVNTTNATLLAAPITNNVVRASPVLVGGINLPVIVKTYTATVNTKTRAYNIVIGRNAEYLLTLPTKPALTESWC